MHSVLNGAKSGTTDKIVSFAAVLESSRLWGGGLRDVTSLKTAAKETTDKTVYHKKKTDVTFDLKIIHFLVFLYFFHIYFARLYITPFPASQTIGVSTGYPTEFVI